MNGRGVLTILLIIFIVLKLCPVIAWSWWIVLWPLWVQVILLGVVFGSILVINLLEKKK